MTHEARSTHRWRPTGDALVRRSFVVLWELGNNDLAKSIEEYGKGNDGRAEEYLDKAANCYDKAVDLVG